MKVTRDVIAKGKVVTKGNFYNDEPFVSYAIGQTKEGIKNIGLPIRALIPALKEVLAGRIMSLKPADDYKYISRKPIEARITEDGNLECTARGLWTLDDTANDDILI